MSAILSFGPQLDMVGTVGRFGWLPFGRSPLLQASDGIRDGFLESPGPPRLRERWGSRAAAPTAVRHWGCRHRCYSV